MEIRILFSLNFLSKILNNSLLNYLPSSGFGICSFHITILISLFLGLPIKYHEYAIMFGKDIYLLLSNNPCIDTHYTVWVWLFFCYLSPTFNGRTKNVLNDFFLVVKGLTNFSYTVFTFKGFINVNRQFYALGWTWKL